MDIYQVISVEDNNALDLATSSPTPSPNKRCYLLELPAELRMTILEIYIQEPVKYVTRWDDILSNKALENGKYQDLGGMWACEDTMDMIDECGILKRRSNLLQSCPQVLLDALPAYEKYLATRVPQFKEKLDRIARWVGLPVGYDKLVKVVDELRRVNQGVGAGA